MGFFCSPVENLRFYYWPWQSCPPLRFGCNGKLSIFIGLKGFLDGGFLYINLFLGWFPSICVLICAETPVITVTGRSPHLQICCSLVMDHFEKDLRLPGHGSLWGNFSPFERMERAVPWQNTTVV